MIFSTVEDGIRDKSDHVLQQFRAFSEDILVAMPLASVSQQASAPLLAAWRYGIPSLGCILEFWTLDPTSRHKAPRMIGPSLCSCATF